MGNKGAQSMTFIVVEEMKKRYTQDNIILLTPINSDDTPYKFNIKRATYRSLNYLKKPINRVKTLLRRIDMNEVKSLDGIFRNARMLIDISGYALSSNWVDAIVKYYLIMIECAERYNIPAYVLPQSFGPFNYAGAKGKAMIRRIAQTMKYPNMIYARETEGYEVMHEVFGLDNIYKSYDIVLMNKGIAPDAIYKEYHKRELPTIKESSVAILPNMRNFDHGDKDIIMNFYKISIQWLREKNKNVYLMHHSKEDAPICEDIKDLFNDDRGVILIKNDLDCFEYEEIVKQFDYIVASRYHSIIHAVRNEVPCIALGWAVKYKDLLAAFNQEKYMLDVRNEFGEDLVFELMSTMEACHLKETENIRARLIDIQKDNIFDMIEKAEGDK